MPSASTWYDVAYGLIGATPTYVAVQASATTAGAYSTNGTSWTASTMPSGGSSVGWTTVAYGNGYFVAAANGTTAGAYSTNGTTWTASTMSSASMWNRITYGNGYYVAVQISGTTAGAYYAFPPLPVAYGIYNGATAVSYTHLTLPTNREV